MLETHMIFAIGDIVLVEVENMTYIGRVIKIRSNRLAFIRYYHPKELKFRGLDVFASKLTHASKDEAEKLNQYARAYNRDVSKVKTNGITGNTEKIVGVFVGVDNG